MFNDREKVETILRHVRRVENNCVTIALKLLDTDPKFARELIQRGREHDLSKLDPFEFEHLWSWDDKFKEALIQHREFNSHHPEHYTQGVSAMTDLDIAEMVADCKARSEEFGTDIQLWFSNPFYKPIWSSIQKYLDLLLYKKFEYPKLN